MGLLSNLLLSVNQAIPLVGSKSTWEQRSLSMVGKETFTRILISVHIIHLHLIMFMGRTLLKLSFMKILLGKQSIQFWKDTMQQC